MSWTDLLAAVAVVAFVEGAACALFPRAVKRAMAHALALPSSTLRRVGLGSAAGAVLVLWVLRD